MIRTKFPTLSPDRKHKPGQTHGLCTMKRTFNALAERGINPIDPNTKVGQSLIEWRDSIIADLGGTENISAMERSLLDVAIKTKLILDSVDAYLLAQPTLVDKTRKILYAVVKDRTTLADSLVRQLNTLGLRRRAKSVPSLTDVIAEIEASKAESAGNFGCAAGFSDA